MAQHRRVPSTLTPDARAAIVAGLRADAGGVRAIAARYNTSPSTVSRIAKAAGIVPSLRPATDLARRANLQDYGAWRAALKVKLIGDAEQLREQLWRACTLHNAGGKEHT